MTLPLRVYFDANMCINVFERTPELFPALKTFVDQGEIELLISDIDLVELLKGDHLDTFDDGISRLLSLSPQWLYLAPLAIREVHYEYLLYQGKKALPPLQVFATWPEFLTHITSLEQRDAISSDVFIPTAAALLDLYPPHSVKDHLNGNWKPELKRYGEAFRKALKKAKSRKELFCETTANAANRRLGKVRSFCGFLWNRPERAPTHRLNLELTFQKLDVDRSKWRMNDFFDCKHAGALPYVDLFVTLDGPLRDRLSWYDANVRVPFSLSPYMEKVCTTWEEFVDRVAALTIESGT
jgi:hypothetical protein